MRVVSDRRRPELFSIAWPLFTELLLGISVGLAGLWLASRNSDAASGAFALANNVQTTFFLLFRIVSVGVSVVITQNLGAGNRAAADQMARASLGASTWLGLATAAAVALAAGPLLTLMQAPAEVLPLALPYLRILALALALDAFNASMSAVMRAHLHARDALLNMVAMHGLHLLLCWPLMGGAGPLPPLGLEGFAIAMVASRAFGVLFHLLLWRLRLQLVPTALDWWALRRRQLAPALHIGLPGAAENIAYRLALMFTIAIVARMGAGALATHSYTMLLMHFVLMSGLAIGFASEILVGHMVGAGHLHAAHQLVRKSLRWGLSVSFVLSVLAALTAPWTMALFTSDPQVIATAQTLMWITVLLEPGRTFNLVVITALRATGDARFPVAAGALSMVVVMAGGAWLLGVHFGLGLAGVWFAYAADEWLRGLTMAARWYRHGWVPHARAVHRRVSAKRRQLQSDALSPKAAARRVDTVSGVQAALPRISTHR
ncbi:MAG TPA: MATE family efflux transporter [Albitalea sp.]|jgi:putative MATE family efflux protein|nr:MATE family efflux transporter [Albitalea sp.]